MARNATTYARGNGKGYGGPARGPGMGEGWGGPARGMRAPFGEGNHPTGEAKAYGKLLANDMRARIAEHAAEIVQAQLDRAIDPAHPQGHAAAVDLLNRIMPPETRQTLAGDPTAPIHRIERVILEPPPREK
ncbi:MAG: hypothetical protein O9313_08225 [Acetobacteraceae bacterium]|nr:hypothetical protein [Acetobacteraceae bacterium]